MFRELLRGVHQGLRGQGIPDATTIEAQRQEVHVEQRDGRVFPENKGRVVRSTSARDANGKRDVRADHQYEQTVTNEFLAGLSLMRSLS